MSSKKYLFSNGCSFLSARTQCPTHAGISLAEMCGLNGIHLGSCGRGNGRVVTTTKLFFYHNPERFKDTFALIGWSNPRRYDYKNYNNAFWGGWARWGDSCWGKWEEHYRDTIGWSTILEGKDKNTLEDNNIARTKRMKHLREILELQDFFNLHGVEYCMYHALRPTAYNWKEESVKTQYFTLLEKGVNKDRFYKFYEYSHSEYVGTKKLTVSKDDGHPNEEGHERWAKKIKRFIDDKCIPY